VAFTDLQKAQIAQAIVAKRPTIAGPITCTICNSRNFAVGDGLVRLVLQPKPSEITLSGPSFPLIPLLCTNCGNTYLINAFQLGLAEVFGISAGIPAALPNKTEGGNG
jgi:hypothetical protein